MKHKLSSPSIFIFDAIGALVSAFFLGIVLVQLNALIGMPVSVLYILAIVPVVLAILDMIFYKWYKSEWQKYIRIIAIANAVYALISLILLFFHAEHLKALGWVYFISEIIILCLMVCFEFKVSAKK